MLVLKLTPCRGRVVAFEPRFTVGESYGGELTRVLKMQAVTSEQQGPVTCIAEVGDQLAVSVGIKV